MSYRDLQDHEIIRYGDEFLIGASLDGWGEWIGVYPTHEGWGKRVDETGMQWRRPVPEQPDELKQPEQPAALPAVDRGERYRRTIRQSLGDGAGLEIEVDIADVCHAFQLPYMLGQAVKKICLPGSRGAKDRLKDLREAAWHIQRQIQIEEAEGNE